MTVDSTVGMVLALAAAWVTVGASVTATGQERGPSSRPAPQPAQVPFDQQAWPGRYPGFAAQTVRAVAPEDVAQQVTCVLQIDSDAIYNPYSGASAAIDARTAASLIRSTPVTQAAVKKAFGDKAPRGRLQDWLVVNAVQTGPRFLEVEVTLLKGDGQSDRDEGRASKLLGALCESLEAALRESVEGPRQQAQRRREKLDQDLAAARQRLEDVRAKSRKDRAETASLGQGVDSRYAAQNLRNQRQSYEQQLANYRARLRAIEPTASPLVAEWRDVVELRQKQLDDLKQQKAPADQVAAQENRLAEAKTQLDTARRTAAETGGSRASSGEVASLQSSIANTAANLKPILEQLAKLDDPKVVAMMEELPELQNEETRIRNEVAELTSRSDQLRRAADTGGEITVRVLDGQPDK